MRSAHTQHMFTALKNPFFRAVVPVHPIYIQSQSSMKFYVRRLIHSRATEIPGALFPLYACVCAGAVSGHGAALRDAGIKYVVEIVRFAKIKCEIFIKRRRN